MAGAEKVAAVVRRILNAQKQQARGGKQRFGDWNSRFEKELASAMVTLYLEEAKRAGVKVADADALATRAGKRASDSARSINETTYRWLAEEHREVKDVFSADRIETIAANEAHYAKFSAVALAAKGKKKKLRWVVSGYNVCPQCMSLAGNIMAPGKNFVAKNGDAVEHPPLHPNAVFSGTTFVPYGGLDEIVCARYDGAGVYIRAGNYQTTIGPNHPVMTKRGMIKAAKLSECDEMLYDLRHNSSIGFISESYLKEIPTVEDAFESARSISGNSLVTAAGPNLHGDRICCKGKVEVVWPQGSLLPIFDSCGVEELREINFGWSDAEEEHCPALCSEGPGNQGVLLASPSSMSCTHSRISANFEWARIHEISFVNFKGLAFDASTPTSLYCSDGFVVSNCKCRLVVV